MFFKGIFYPLSQISTAEALALLENYQVADDVQDQCIASINKGQSEVEIGKNSLGGFCYSDEDFDVGDILESVYSTEDKNKTLRTGSIAQFLKYRDSGFPCPDSVLLILDEEKGVVATFDDRGFCLSWWVGDFDSEYKLFLVKEE